MYALDGNPYQSSPEFTGLEPGVHTLSIIDGNYCETQEHILIEASTDVMVELGDDHIILPGESVTIEAITNIPVDSIQSISWEGLVDPDCQNCLTQIVTPSTSALYVVSITSYDGCVARDTIRVIVKEDSDVFIPNIFSPNGDGINDRLVIIANAEIEEIESLRIFDRWGTLVHGADHLLPGDPSTSWDGSMKGEPLNPAVFVYRIILRFSDGHQEIRHGDFTLIR
jgi:gliding motility-associated-like protein